MKKEYKILIASVVLFGITLSGLLGYGIFQPKQAEEELPFEPFFSAYSPLSGFVSTNNSSTSTLAGDAVFTGVGDDVSNYASVSILYKSDVAAAASGLSMQFSQDNTNWDVQLVGNLGAKTFQVHSLKPTAKFFRVVYTNGSAAQSTFRLQVIYHSAASPVLISRTGQPQSTIDATPTRLTTDIDLDYAREHIPGGRAFFFFGFNDAVGNSAFEDIHPGSANIDWLKTATTVEIFSSHAADDTAGLGLRSVEIHGLSLTGVDQKETVQLDGTTHVFSTKEYIRLNKMHNEDVGTYGGSHQGDITFQSKCDGCTGTAMGMMTGIEGAADSTVQYGSGEAGNGYWTVPLGKVMYITRLEVIPDVATNKFVDIVLYEREGVLTTTTAPFLPRRVLWQERSIDSSISKEFKSHIKIKGLTDVFFRAKSTSGTSLIEVSLDFYLVDADADGQ